MGLILTDARGNELIADGPSKATRVLLSATPSDDLQVDAVPVPRASYVAAVNMRFTGATTAGSVILAFRALQWLVKVRRVSLTLGFDGTATNSTIVIGAARFYGGSITGAAMGTPVRKRTQYPYSGSELYSSATGAALTVPTGLQLDPDLTSLSLPLFMGLVAASQPARIARDIDVERATADWASIDLEPGSGLLLRMTTAAIIGLSICGFVGWDEFTYA